MIKNLFVSVLVAILLSGCVVKALTVGHEQSFCEENGCENADAGKCASPYQILKERFGQ